MYNTLTGKPEQNKPVGEPRRRCENNIKMDLSEVVLESVDWIFVA